MEKQRITSIVQARMGSSRLPGKVLLDIAGKPMLQWVVERVRLSRLVDEVVVATTDAPDDEQIALFCQQNAISFMRGSPHDVLDRYYQAALQFKADIIVRVTADCPLIDPLVIDHTIANFLQQDVDFAANRLPPPWKRTYPIGLDTEVCTFTGLQRAWTEAKEPFEREHVMPYFYDLEGRFKILLVNHDPDYGHLRWTVDTQQDLDLVRRIVDHFNGQVDFHWHEILAFVEEHPELSEINADVKAKMTQEVDENRK
ncbi:MAG: glycosyltransferase family protein [Chloroflexi bacterium]|nr:glycosyltransferase family protein [Chloroflexota bacterium]